LEAFLRTWESTKDGQIQAIVNGEKVTIDQALIAKQFSVNTEGAMDAANALIKEALVALKNIDGLDAFINKKQWNVIWMKEECHAKFTTILQIIYQRERLSHFSNRIAITLNLVNRGRIINWCSIMVAQMSI